MRKRFACLFMVSALTAGCVPQPPRAPEAGGPAPADFPSQRYQALSARGEPIFRIDPARSLVVIEVRRAGSLARLGHDHVVASHEVQGYVAPNDGRADLYVPLEGMTVDEPSLRAEAGFDTVPTESDIAGTRQNMLTRVLEVERYPFARVALSNARPASTDDIGDVEIGLHGVTHPARIPLRIESKSDEIVVTGSVTLKQTDFRITPLSILGGAIQVADEVRLRFGIVARRCVAPMCR
jgi:hypothetical protein